MGGIGHYNKFIAKAFPHHTRASDLQMQVVVGIMCPAATEGLVSREEERGHWE